MNLHFLRQSDHSERAARSLSRQGLQVYPCGDGLQALKNWRAIHFNSVLLNLTPPGLGLAICKEIVQVLDGTISLHNRVQYGVVTGLDATVRPPSIT